MTSTAHPFAQSIRDIHALGHVVRLVVDARRNDVAVPERVRAEGKSRLVLDLDPRMPLALEESPTGVSMSLAFGGVVARCRVAWEAIYMLFDQTTGQLRAQRPLPPDALDPQLTAHVGMVCSFCLKSHREVKVLVAGPPGAFICEECVQLSVEIVNEREPGLLAAPAAPPTSAPETLRVLLQSLPARSHIDAYGHVAGIGRELARGDANVLREVSHALGNALAFEHALALRASIAPMDRRPADAISEAAYRARIGEARQAVQLYEGLVGLSPSDEVVVALGRAYARLGTRTLAPSELPSIETELDAIEPRLGGLGLDAGLLRGLTNQLTHVRARILATKRRERDAIALLGRHLDERPHDTEALAVLVEVADRIGDTASSTTARDRALAFTPKGSAFERRLLGR